MIKTERESMPPTLWTSTANCCPSVDRRPQPRHTGMTYSKQHYILQEQRYLQTLVNMNLLHSESQAEAEGMSTDCNTNIILKGHRTVKTKPEQKFGF